jgi:hypothetical protein
MEKDSNGELDLCSDDEDVMIIEENMPNIISTGRLYIHINVCRSLCVSIFI